MPQDPSHLDFGELSENRQQDIDSICNRFECAWRAGSLPRIRDFLTGSSDQSASAILFRELLRIEIEQRRASGDEPSLNEYLSEFPGRESIVRAEFERRAPAAVPDTTEQSQPGHLTSHQSTLPVGWTSGPTAPTSAGASPSQSTTSLASRYQLGPEIARGGMGVVHRATDLAFRREVAIKLLRPRWEQQPDPVIQRHQIAEAIESFRYEAQITARLQHPGIPPVHELGVLEQGFPFLAMKLIQGRTLQELLDERADLHADLPRWLQIFEQIAQAVGYAHSHGILHRDLKPLNIMVGEFGEVQVMDWGLAKVLGTAPSAGSAPPSEQTAAAKSDSDSRLYQSQPGDIKGTLQYMPPEQARGEIAQLDERADVFGLGAILCQILTGEPPYTNPTKSEIQRAAAAGDLDAAFARLKGSGVDSDLIDLALRCLAPKPESRPASGTAVAHAIATYRDHVDLRLRQAETERARSEQRRLEQGKQRWLWYGIAAILLVLAVYFAGANHVIGKKEKAANDAAMMAKKEEKRASNEAEVALEITNFLERDLLALASAREQAQQRVTLDPDLKVRDLVLRAANKVDDKFKDKPHVEVHLRETIAGTLLGLGEFEAAIKHQTRALELRTELNGAEHVDTLAAQVTLATFYFLHGNQVKAVALYEAALKQEQKTLGEDHPNTLYTKSSLASLYTEMGKADVSLPMLEELVKVRKVKQGPEHPETLLAMNNLALAYRAVTQLDRATKLFEETLQKQKGKIGADHPDTLGTMNNLAATHFSAGRLDQAAVLFEEIWNVRKEKLGVAHAMTLASQGRLATTLQSAGQMERALPLLEDTLEQLRTRLGASHFQTLGTMSNLAKAYQASGQKDKAIKLNEEALAGLEKLLGKDHLDTLSVRANLAASYHSGGQPDKALPLYEEVRQQLQAKIGADHPNVLGIMNNMAAAYRQTEQPEKALALYQETVELSTKKLGAGHLETLRPLTSLAHTEIQLKKYAEAEEHLGQLWMHIQKLPPAIGKQFAVGTAKAYVVLYTLQEKPEQAEKWMKELALLEPESPAR